MRRLLFLFAAFLTTGATTEARQAPVFRAGVAQRDISPPAGLPMWGYAARHDAPATGTLDPLTATATVIQAGTEKLAIVATDLGRGPTPSMLAEIQKRVDQKAGIKHVLICGSHTHHGPVLELTGRKGRGAGRFDSAVAYASGLPAQIADCILDADAKLKDARIGVAHEEVSFSRNRQAKKRTKVVDPLLNVLRLDDLEGKPIAILVNFAAHPTMTESKLLKYSADYPGYLRSVVQTQLGAPCLFLQGAAGDVSTSSPGGTEPGPSGFGTALGRKAAELAKRTKTEIPSRPEIRAESATVHFSTRIDLGNPLVQTLYGRAFFPELIAATGDEHAKGIDAQLNTVVLNGNLALVGVSGEFFSDHANRLRARLDLDTLFLGYCNGHHYYFPTIEAASEGGYGTEPGICLAELGSGETLMNRALLSLYRMMGRIPTESK